MPDLFAPGEPATDVTEPVEPAAPAPVENADQPTGTDMDTARDIPEMDDDAIANALAAAMRGEEPDLQNPPSADTGLTAPVDGPADPASADLTQPVPGAAPTDQPPVTPSPDTPAGATASPPTVIDLPGVGQVTPEQANEIASLYQWAQGLTAEQAQAINDVLSGQYALAPRPPALDPSAASGPGVPSPAAGVGAPAGVGSTPASPYYAPVPTTPPADQAPFDPSQYADPELARLVYDQQRETAALRADLAAQQQAAARAAAQQVQQEQARLQAEADIATSEFAEAHQLDAATANRLVQTATSLQVIPSLYAKHNDPRKAMTEALEIAYWTDPTTRAQAIQAQVEQFANQSAATDDKKRRAASLSGAGGAVPRTTPPAQPLTREQREQAMIAEISTAMNGSQG